MDCHSTNASVNEIEVTESKAARETRKGRIRKGLYRGLMVSSLAIGGVLASNASLVASVADTQQCDGGYVQASAGTALSANNNQVKTIGVSDKVSDGDIYSELVYAQSHQFDFASVKEADDGDGGSEAEDGPMALDKTSLGRYTFISAVDAAPFPMQRMVDAAYEAEHQKASDVSGGTKKRAYVSDEAVDEVAAKQERDESESANAEGKRIVRTLEVDIAGKASQKTASESTEAPRTADGGIEDDGWYDPAEENLVKKDGADSDAVLEGETKLSVSGELKETLDAATAEKKDQVAKAEAKAEAERQAYLASEEGQREMILEAAYSRLGVPYVWGGTDPDNGMDCSGFTQWCYSTIGIETTRTTYSQYDACNQVVSLEDAKPGDILYSGGHVGIYIGNGEYIHEPQSGDVCRIASDISQFSCALRFI